MATLEIRKEMMPFSLKPCYALYPVDRKDRKWHAWGFRTQAQAMEWAAAAGHVVINSRGRKS